MKQLPNPSRIACLFAAVLISMAALLSCSQYDDTGIKDSIVGLQERIDSLEKYVHAMQSNIDNLKATAERLSQNVTADTVVETDDGWIIRMSDGKDIVLTDGKNGDNATGVRPPSITIIEEDGMYWWGYVDETGEHFFQDGDNRFPCTSATPQIRINEDGNWEISLDGGLNWDDTGVKAVGEDGKDGDSFIDSITDDEENFYILLGNGSSIVLPKTQELSLTLDCEETEYFTAGETRVIGYTVTGSGIITFTKPNGWKVSIDGEASSISITAPAAENTYAEQKGIISLLLVAFDGSSFSTGLEVAVGTKPAPVLEDPEIGDYLYSDGTWSTDLDAGKTVAGVVFWAGDPSEADPMLQSDFPGCTHGLAVSLVQYDNTAWQTNVSGKVTDWITEKGYEYLPLENNMYDTGGLSHKIIGYNNTLAMIQFSEENPSNTIDIVTRLEEHRQQYPDPENTSGWYCPSLFELTLLCSGEDNISGTIIGVSSTSMKDRLDPILAEVEGSQPMSGNCWSTSENGTNVQTKDFGSGFVMTPSKSSDQQSVRFVLAF